MLQTFWDLFWFTLVIFAFAAYLVILFHVITDIFRDRELSAWAKVLWLIALVLFPYLSSFAYLLFRGSGLVERQVARATAQRDAAESYVREVAGTGPAQEIAQAKKLLDDGVLSQEEFEALKARALA